jgi:hypothetical protein
MSYARLTAADGEEGWPEMSRMYAYNFFFNALYKLE